MIPKFLKAHWLGLLGLAALVFLMCCDVEFTSQSAKVDAEGEYVMTKTIGTRGGDLFINAIGKQVEQEVEWRFHRPYAGSLWLNWTTAVGTKHFRLPLWILVLATLLGMVLIAAFSKPKPATAAPAPDPAPTPSDPAPKTDSDSPAA